MYGKRDQTPPQLSDEALVGLSESDLFEMIHMREGGHLYQSPKIREVLYANGVGLVNETTKDYLRVVLASRRSQKVEESPELDLDFIIQSEGTIVGDEEAMIFMSPTASVIFEGADIKMGYLEKERESEVPLPNISVQVEILAPETVKWLDHTANTFGVDPAGSSYDKDVEKREIEESREKCHRIVAQNFSSRPDLREEGVVKSSLDQLDEILSIQGDCGVQVSLPVDPVLIPEVTQKLVSIAACGGHDYNNSSIYSVACMSQRQAEILDRKFISQTEFPKFPGDSMVLHRHVYHTLNLTHGAEVVCETVSEKTAYFGPSKLSIALLVVNDKAPVFRKDELRMYHHLHTRMGSECSKCGHIRYGIEDYLAAYTRTYCTSCDTQWRPKNLKMPDRLEFSRLSRYRSSKRVYMTTGDCVFGFLVPNTIDEPPFNRFSFGARHQHSPHDYSLHDWYMSQDYPFYYLARFLGFLSSLPDGSSFALIGNELFRDVLMSHVKRYHMPNLQRGRERTYYFPPWPLCGARHPQGRHIIPVKKREVMAVPGVYLEVDIRKDIPVGLVKMNLRKGEDNLKMFAQTYFAENGPPGLLDRYRAIVKIRNPAVILVYANGSQGLALLFCWYVKLMVDPDIRIRV